MQLLISKWNETYLNQVFVRNKSFGALSVMSELIDFSYISRDKRKANMYQKLSLIHTWDYIGTPSI